MKIIPCFTFKTGIVRLKQESPHLYRVFVTVNKSISANVCVGMLSILSDKGIILLEKSFTCTAEHIEQVVDILNKHVNIYKAGYNKAIILFSGEEYDFEDYSNLLSDWNQETEKLLEITA